MGFCGWTSGPAWVSDEKGIMGLVCVWGWVIDWTVFEGRWVFFVIMIYISHLWWFYNFVIYVTWNMQCVTYVTMGLCLEKEKGWRGWEHAFLGSKVIVDTYVTLSNTGILWCLRRHRVMMVLWRWGIREWILNQGDAMVFWCFMCRFGTLWNLVRESIIFGEVEVCWHQYLN